MLKSKLKRSYQLKEHNKFNHLNQTMKEKKKTSSIAVLSRGDHQIKVAMLHKHVCYPFFMYHWSLRYHILLFSKEKKKQSIFFCHSSNFYTVEDFIMIVTFSIDNIYHNRCKSYMIQVIRDS